MSAKAMFWALELEDLTPAQKLVLLLLANHADENNTCWPSVARLADKANLGRSTIFRLLSELEVAGLLIRDARVNETGGQSSNLFTLQVVAAAFRSPKNAPTPPSQYETPPVPDRDPPRPNLGPKSNIEPNTTNRTLSPPVLSTPDTFDAWWDVYPRKIAKASARKAYRQALKKIPAKSLLKLTNAFSFGTEEKYIPHPATWLNTERWIEAEASVQPFNPNRLSEEEVRIMHWQKNAYWNPDWGTRPDRREIA